MRKKHLAIAALMTAGALTLAACGSDDSMGDMPGHGTSSSATATPDVSATNEFNDADVAFATEMIPHHRQAVEMAELAESRAETTAVKDLAEQIMGAQDPEIEKMSGWLSTWGKPVPEEMPGMDHSGSMPGMMSADEMDQLTNASGAEFDQMFLTMMIAHHQGAITMAVTEQSSGRNPEAIALAEQIETAQTGEISTMQALLK